MEADVNQSSDFEIMLAKLLFTLKRHDIPAYACENVRRVISQAEDLLARKGSRAFLREAAARHFERVSGKPRIVGKYLLTRKHINKTNNKT